VTFKAVLALRSPARPRSRRQTLNTFDLPTYNLLGVLRRRDSLLNHCRCPYKTISNFTLSRPVHIHAHRTCPHVSPFLQGGFPRATRTQEHLISIPTVPMSSASKKRKFGDVTPPTKYYAVRAGHKPGVYSNWADCQANITGFKGASCKPSIHAYLLRNRVLISTERSQIFYLVARS
jgi:hypothetical protein